MLASTKRSLFSEEAEEYNIDVRDAVMEAVFVAAAMKTLQVAESTLLSIHQVAATVNIRLPIHHLRTKSLQKS